MNEIDQLKKYILYSKELSKPLGYLYDLMDINTFSKYKNYREVIDVPQRSDLIYVIQLILKSTNKILGKSIKQLYPSLQ